MANRRAYRPQKNSRTHARRELLAMLDARDWLSYDRVVQRLPFLTFLSLLAAMYIGNRHTVERQSRDLDNIRQELTELAWYYDTANDELARRSRQSEVAERVASQGIHELTAPPRIIAATPVTLKKGVRREPQRAGLYPFALIEGQADVLTSQPEQP